MKRFLSMYRVEQKLFLRTPDVILFCLAMPLVVFVVITMITGGKNAADSGLTYLQSSYVSLSTVGICCSAFMSIPITVVECRSQGILRRMYCSPCSPARILVCDTLCSGGMAASSTRNREDHCSWKGEVSVCTGLCILCVGSEGCGQRDGWPSA